MGGKLAVVALDIVAAGIVGSGIAERMAGFSGSTRTHRQFGRLTDTRQNRIVPMMDCTPIVSDKLGLMIRLVDSSPT